MTVAIALLLLKTTLVVALALAVMPLLHRHSAALRHWVLLAALTAAAVLPILSVVAPSWTLPGTRATTTPHYSSAMVVVDAVPAAVVGETPRSASPVAADLLARGLAGIWLGGVLVNLVALLVGLTRLRRMTATSVEADRRWHDETARAMALLGQHRSVQTRAAERDDLLLTWGARRPIVLIPADTSSWPLDRVRAVAAHEAGHIARHDWLTQLLAEMVRACYWFNPLIWLACARLRRESERACDDLVLGLGVEPHAYATHLVALARSFSAHSHVWLPAPGMARASHLQRRVRAMLTPHLDRRPLSTSLRTTIAAVMIGAALTMAGLGAQSATSVAGIVRDPSGRVLANVTVKLANADGAWTHEVQTGSDGDFAFAQLPSGDYFLSTQLLGFSRLVEGITLADGARVHKNLTMQVAVLQESVTVSGTSGPANTKAPARIQEAAVPSPTCTPSAEGGQLLPPWRTRNVPPSYPQGLQDANVTGTVKLIANIGVDGIVKQVRSVTPNDSGLEDAAIAAVSQWRYTPTLLNCEPIEVQMYATVVYSLNR